MPLCVCFGNTIYTHAHRCVETQLIVLCVALRGPSVFGLRLSVTSVSPPQLIHQHYLMHANTQMYGSTAHA